MSFMYLHNRKCATLCFGVILSGRNIFSLLLKVLNRILYVTAFLSNRVLCGTGFLCSRWTSELELDFNYCHWVVHELNYILEPQAIWDEDYSASKVSMSRPPSSGTCFLHTCVQPPLVVNISEMGW